MPPASSSEDAPIQLDMANCCLWRGTQRIVLRPKDCAVLQRLAAHPGQVVPKAALLDAGWPDVYVSEGVLKDSVYRLRRALGDQGNPPRFIETVSRKGYRLLRLIPFVDASILTEHRLSPPSLSPGLVGREGILAQMQAWFARACAAKRQVGFVSGEVGLGKTALVETFLGQVAARGDVQVLRGQCVQSYGMGEAYLPIFEALHHACRDAQRERCLAVLRQLAPTWLVHMPGLLDAAAYKVLQRQHGNSTRERMLRELANALDALADAAPLVLVLEDLHWSDHATLDVVTLVTRRQEPARLLLLGTLRPEEVWATDHPLRTLLPTLRRLPHVTELSLTGLTTADVSTYLTACFPINALPAHLAAVLHHRTAGNPLFLVNTVDHLVAQGVLYRQDETWSLREGYAAVVADIPATVREVIGQRQAMCNRDEQQVVAVASVAGQTFSAASVAAGIDDDVVRTEAWCEGLAQRELFLQTQGVETWPDGTVATRYGFRHTLYQQVLYEQIPAARRVQLHRRVGRREEIGYGARASEIAARLALHFELGNDYLRAITYYRHAATNALRCYAYREAIAHCQHSLTLLATLPETPDRHQRELDIQTILGPVLMVTKSPVDPDVQLAYARAHALSQQVGKSPKLVWALEGLWAFYLVRGKFHMARELGLQLQEVTQELRSPSLSVIAQQALGLSLLYLGEFTAAREHLEQGYAAYCAEQRPDQTTRGVHDPGVMCGAFAALATCVLGQPQRALQRSYEMLSLAQQIAHPYSLAFAYCAAAVTRQCRGEAPEVYELADVAIRLATEQGFPLWSAMGTVFRGWAMAMQGQPTEGIAGIQRGIAIWQAAGAQNVLPYYFVMLAEAHWHAGQINAALQRLDETLDLINTTEERWWEAEVYRLRGECLLQHRTADEREAAQCFHQALSVARRQHAKLWELRAATSLGTLWQQQGRRQEAYQLLAQVYGWFTEALDTPDLQQARELLAQLKTEG